MSRLVTKNQKLVNFLSLFKSLSPRGKDDANTFIIFHAITKFHTSILKQQIEMTCRYIRSQETSNQCYPRHAYPDVGSLVFNGIYSQESVYGMRIASHIRNRKCCVSVFRKAGFSANIFQQIFSCRAQEKAIKLQIRSLFLSEKPEQCLLLTYVFTHYLEREQF